MKILLPSTLVVLAISFAVPSFAQEQNTVDPEVRQQIEEAYKKLHDAYNNHDVAATAALFTQDAVQVNGTGTGLGGGVISGQEAIKKSFEIELSARGVISGRILQSYMVGSEVCAISEYTAQRHHNGYAVTIYVLDADEWKIRMQYFN
jgi:ketosteroid isomerase-like protein